MLKIFQESQALVPAAAKIFMRSIAFRGPVNLTIRPDSKVEIASEREATIEFL